VEPPGVSGTAAPSSDLSSHAVSGRDNVAYVREYTKGRYKGEARCGGSKASTKTKLGSKAGAK